MGRVWVRALRQSDAIPDPNAAAGKRSPHTQTQTQTQTRTAGFKKRVRHQAAGRHRRTSFSPDPFCSMAYLYFNAPAEPRGSFDCNRSQ